MLSTPLKFKFSRNNVRTLVFCLAIAAASFGFLFFSGGKVFAADCSSLTNWQGTNSFCDVTFQDAGGSNLTTCEYKLFNTKTVPGGYDTGWLSAGTCSGGSSSTLTLSITVGSLQNCRDQGTGACELSTKATDSSGNIIQPYPTVIKNFNIDYTPPTVSVAGAPFNWQQTNASASVSCSDFPGSGCDTSTQRLKTYTSSGGCSTTYTDYTLLDPWIISSNLWVCAAAKDVAGNVGFSSSRTEFKVDPNPPTISVFTVSPIYPYSVTTGQPTLTVSWTVADTGGSHLQKVTIWRALFDASTCNGTNNSTCAFAFDPQANPPAPPANSDSWQNTYSYSPTGDNIYEYGIHVIDNAQWERTETQNDLSTKTVRIKLTNAAPTLSSVVLSPSSPFKPGVQLTFTGNWTDPEQSEGESSRLFICKNNGIPSGNNCSGGDKDKWCVSGSSVTSPSVCNDYTTQAADEGTKTYYAFECDDGQGSLCSSALGPYTFLIDATPPTISVFSISPVPPNWANTANPNINISWTAADNIGGSGIKRYELWRAPDNKGSPGDWGTSPVPGKENISPSATSTTDNPGNGTWWYGLHAVDGVGNCIAESGVHCPGGVLSDSLDPRTPQGPKKVQVDTVAPSKPTCTNPDGSPAGGTFQNSASIICSAEGGATIRFTETPLFAVVIPPTTSSTQYTSPFTISNSETLTFAAWDPAGNRSISPDNPYSFTIVYNTPPQAVSLQDDHATVNYCSTTGFVISPPITLSWQFQDPDAGAYELAYQVQISTNNFGSISFDSGQVSVPANVVHNGDRSSYAPPAGAFGYGTTYYWRVKVWDDQSASSSFVNGSTFSTPVHSYPVPDFSWSPASPSAKEQVQFTDQTNFSPLASGKSWSWNFGDSSSSAQQNPTHKYAQNGSYAVFLTVSDNAGGTCSKSKTLNIGIPFPQWQEISPF